MLHITQLNHSFIHLSTDTETLKRIKARFSFEIEDAQKAINAAKYAARMHEATPKQKRLIEWNGKVCFVKYNKMYRGLLSQLLRFCQDEKIKVQCTNVNRISSIDPSVIKRFIRRQKLPFPLYQHQLDAFSHAVEKQRCIIVSPTASGKSLIMYLLAKWHKNEKCLILVDKRALALQLRNDFVSYGGKEEDYTIIMSGYKEDDAKNIVIATWQSIRKKSNDWFAKFNNLICDEVHGATAKNISSIIEKMENCCFRVGLTGTLPDNECKLASLTGLFGESKQIAKMHELIEKGINTETKVSILTINHPNATVADYDEELQYLVESPERNKFIIEKANSLPGTVLVLYRFINHGNRLHEIAKEYNKKVFLIHGNIKVEEREQIRQQIESEENVLVIASMGVFSTGINIKRLQSLIFACSIKGKIKLLQSIGRILRLSEYKTIANVIDIFDNFPYSEDHLQHRIEQYKKEKIPYYFDGEISI